MNSIVTHGEDAPPDDSSPRSFWERAIVRHGLWAAVACALIWNLTGQLDRKLEALELSLAQHVRATELDQREMRVYLRQICLNTAETEAARAGCIQPIQER